jgi:hypothetical protein
VAQLILIESTPQDLDLQLTSMIVRIYPLGGDNPAMPTVSTTPVGLANTNDFYTLHTGAHIDQCLRRFLASLSVRPTVTILAAPGQLWHWGGRDGLLILSQTPSQSGLWLRCAAFRAISGFISTHSEQWLLGSHSAVIHRAWAQLALI